MENLLQSLFKQASIFRFYLNVALYELINAQLLLADIFPPPHTTLRGILRSLSIHNTFKSRIRISVSTRQALYV
jgi:hypothetical protein